MNFFFLKKKREPISKKKPKQKLKNYKNKGKT